MKFKIVHQMTLMLLKDFNFIKFDSKRFLDLKEC